jgi:hypothetical protein
MLFRPGTKPTEIVITLWLQAQSLTIAWKRHPIEQEVRLMVEANLSYRNPGECGPRLRINHFSGLSFWMISTSHFLWQRQQTCTFTETAFPQRKTWKTRFQMSLPMAQPCPANLFSSTVGTVGPIHTPPRYRWLSTIRQCFASCYGLDDEILRFQPSPKSKGTEELAA